MLLLALKRKDRYTSSRVLERRGSDKVKNTNETLRHGHRLWCKKGLGTLTKLIVRNGGPDKLTNRPTENQTYEASCMLKTRNITEFLLRLRVIFASFFLINVLKNPGEVKLNCD